MRVVAGTARGRRITSPEGRRVRPTSDRVREAVFNSLGSLGAVAQARVLDLFAGSGAMGIEALSRGSASAVFVDADPATRQIVEANLVGTGLADSADTRIVVADVETFLTSSSTTSIPFDLVMLDPPYAFDEWPELLALLEGHLAADAVVVCESDREVSVPAGWMISRVKRYGGTVVTTTSTRGAPLSTPGAIP